MKRITDEQYKSINEAQEWVALNADDVEKINEQWSQISDLVERGDVDNCAMINSVKRTLTEEQDASLRSLLEESRNIPYEELAVHQLEAERAVEVLRQKIEQIESSTSKKQERLMQQKLLLESVVPAASKILDDITNEEIKKTKDAEVAVFKGQLDSAELELATIGELFEKTGRAWSIPSLADVNYEPAEDEIFTIDQFPNEREITSERIADKVTRAFESRLQDASSYLALLLKEKPGHIWTDEELGYYIYDDNDDRKRNGSRARSLLSQYNRGNSASMAEIIGNDLVLQRGKRQVFDARTGKSIPRTVKAVWRLVDIETAAHSQTITTMNSDRTLRQSYGEWEPAEIQTFKLYQLPSGEYDGNKLVEQSDGVGEESKEDAVIEKHNWQEGFTEAVHKTVEDLKGTGLMTDREITWKSLRIRSKSTIAGTETARERAYSAKVIKRSEMSEDSLVDMSKVVMSLMLNVFPNVFRVSSRRKEAVRIVEGIVEDYFRQHDKQQSKQ